MSKVILSDKEFNALPDVSPKKLKKIVLSDKEFQNLPSTSPEEPPKEDMSFGESALEAVGTAGEYIDRYTGAPIRKGIGAALDPNSDKGVLESVIGQIGEPTSEAPTGKELAQKMGVSDDVIIKDFPVIGDITKSGLLGFGIEMVADPLTMASGAAKAVKFAAKPFKVALKSKAAKNAFQAIARESSVGKVAGILNKRPQEITAMSVIQEDLVKNLNKPKELLNKIKGRETAKWKSIGMGDRIVGESARKGGKISEISKDTEAIINSIKNKVPTTSVNGLISDISNQDVIGRLQRTRTDLPFNTKDIEKYEKILKEVLKPIGEGHGLENQVSISDLQKMKKNLGKSLNSAVFYAPADKDIALRKEVMKAAYFNLQRRIESLTEGIPISYQGKTIDAASLIKANNQSVNTLIDVANLLEVVGAKELKNPTVLEKTLDGISSMLAGGAVYATTGSPYAGISAAGAWHLGKSSKDITRGIPAALAKTQAALASPIGVNALDKASLLTSPARVNMNNDRISRGPQSIPEALIETRIPRSSDAILQNKNVILAKVAQEMPQIFDHVVELIENRPEDMEEIVPLLTKMAPSMFEQDKYGRFNGKITDPNNAQRAIKDTLKRDDLSNTQKIEAINKLNKTGEFDL